MTKYIVSGYIGFDNFGDEAIARVLVEKLRAKDAEEITLISSNPEKTARLYNVKSCGMLKFLPYLRQSDVLVSGGGSLLQDVTSLKSLIYYLGVIYSALILRKKVVIFAQGIGPIKSKIGALLTRFALKKAVKISVRDKKSQELLESWNIASELVHDPILDLSLENRGKKGTVGVQLRKFAGLNDEFLHTLAQEIAKRFGDKKIEILSLQDSIDSEVCHKFCDFLKKSGMENSTVFENLSSDEIIEHIQNLEYLIAMRFHANVVGIKSGVKTLAINYDPKVEKLAEEFNIPTVDLNQTDLSHAFNKLQDINF